MRLSEKLSYDRNKVVLNGRGHLYGLINMSIGFPVVVLLVVTGVVAIRSTRDILPILFIVLVLGALITVMTMIFLAGFRSLREALRFKFILTENELILKSGTNYLYLTPSDITHVSSSAMELTINESTSKTDSGDILVEYEDGSEWIKAATGLQKTIFYFNLFGETESPIDKTEYALTYKSSLSPVRHKIEKAVGIGRLVFYCAIIALAVGVVIFFIAIMLGWMPNSDTLTLKGRTVSFKTDRVHEIDVTEIKTLEFIDEPLVSERTGRGGSWRTVDGQRTEERYYIIMHETRHQFYGKLVTKSGMELVFSYKTREGLEKLINKINAKKSEVEAAQAAPNALAPIFHLACGYKE